MLQSKRADSLKNEMKDSGYNTNTNNVSTSNQFNLQTLLLMANLADVQDACKQQRWRESKLAK